MNSGLCISFLAAFGFSALAETGTQAATTTTQSPTVACSQLVDAAKTGDINAFHSNVLGTKKSGTGRRFAKMGHDYMEKIKTISCGAEHIAGDRAFVESETNGEKRFIPFVQKEGQWKFDMKTYRSFYSEQKGPMRKKM